MTDNDQQPQPTDGLDQLANAVTAAILESESERLQDLGQQGILSTRATELIRQERVRQILVEDYDPDHDHGHERELAAAGASYALADLLRQPDLARAIGLPQMSGDDVAPTWPWHKSYWKPVPDDRVRELVKAGALIAAAIDAILESEQLPPQVEATQVDGPPVP